MPYAMTAMQEKSQWCWAAVSFNVDHYFSPTSPWTQCAIATTVLKIDPCCLDPSTDERCDRAAHIEDALATVGRPFAIHRGALPFADIQIEIQAQRPICARIGWDEQHGHFVIIAGYRVLTSGLRQLWILDSLFGPSLQDAEVFRTAYRLCGIWTDTYLMR